MNIKELYRLYLASCGVVSTDSRKISQGCLFFALRGENFDGNRFASEAISKGASAAVIDDKKYHDPERNLFWVEDGLAALQALAVYHRRQFSIPFIAIAGSNGKTTTKELLVAALSKKFKIHATKGNLNNHIGVPLTLLSTPAEAQMCIVEMGAARQKEIGSLCAIAQPDYGYITSFGQAHLEGFGSFEGIVYGKSELYQYLKLHDKKAFVNADDSVQIEKSQGIRRYGFSQGAVADVQIRQMDGSSGLRLIFKGLEIRPQLIGAYNFANVAAAVAIGDYFGVSAEQIKSAVESYAPSNNRSQLIRRGELEIILDAYNANPSSMREALLSFARLEGHKTAILGDMFELGTFEQKAHEEVVRMAQTTAIDRLLLVGDRFCQVSVDDERVIQFRDKETLIRFFERSTNSGGRALDQRFSQDGFGASARCIIV